MRLFAPTITISDIVEVSVWLLLTPIMMLVAVKALRRFWYNEHVTRPVPIRRNMLNNVGQKKEKTVGEYAILYLVTRVQAI